MDALRAEVQAILENKEDEEVDLVQFKELWHQMRKELQDNDSSAYSEQARQWAVENGLIAGKRNDSGWSAELYVGRCSHERAAYHRPGSVSPR